MFVCDCGIGNCRNIKIEWIWTLSLFFLEGKWGMPKQFLHAFSPIFLFGFALLCSPSHRSISISLYFLTFSLFLSLSLCLYLLLSPYLPLNVCPILNYVSVIHIIFLFTFLSFVKFVRNFPYYFFPVFVCLRRHLKIVCVSLVVIFVVVCRIFYCVSLKYYVYGLADIFLTDIFLFLPPLFLTSCSLSFYARYWTRVAEGEGK